MDTKKYFFVFTILLMFIISIYPVDLTAAIHGIIKGTVTDSLTGKPLPGANIFLSETSLGAASNLEGEYRILMIPSDRYELIVSFIGYQKKTVSVNVQPNATIIVDIKLNYETLTGETIVVTAQAVGQLAAINQQLSSRIITNIVSKARIEELPDANAAESVGRLPGVSIIRDAGEGTKVAIRGMQPKLNLITINGVRIPATDLDDRSVDMSMISSNILDGIEVAKALTPDKDADAIGGTVDFKLRRSQEGFHTTLLLQGGYNGQESSYKAFKVLGNVSNRFFENKLGVIAQVNFERADRGTDRFDATYVRLREKLPDEETAPIRITTLRLKDRHETRDRYGASLLLDYELSNGKLMFNSLFTRLDRDVIQQMEQYSLEFVAKDNEVRQQNIITDLIMNSFSGEYSIFGINADWNLSYSQSLQKIPKDYRLHFRETQAFSSPPSPDKGPEQFPLLANHNLDHVFLQFIIKETSKSDEKDLIGQLNFERPFTLSSMISGNLKIGGKYRDKNRMYDLSRWQAPMYYGSDARDVFPDMFPDVIRNAEGDFMMESFLDPDYSSGDFLDGQYFIKYACDVDFMNTVMDSTSPYLYDMIDADANDYTATEKISAAYIMAEINLGQKLMFLPGVRFEHEKTSFDAYINNITISGQGDPIGEIKKVSSTRDLKKWFPMFHLRYKVTDWFAIRLAQTKTMSRPDFRYISPRKRIIDSSQYYSRANPDLQPAVSMNYDLSLSFYNRRFGLLSFSGFYKEIEDLFFSFERQILDPEKENVHAQYKNYRLHDIINSPHTTYVRGLEIDLQTQLRFLPGIFKGVVINANYTIISTSTLYPFSLVKTISLRPLKMVRIDSTRSGRMIYQPNHILNLAIGYDYRGFSGRLSLLYQGNTLSKVGEREEADGYTDDLVRWDLSLKQYIWGGLELFFHLNNISDRPDRLYEPVHNWDTRMEYFGLTADLGVRYRF
jgi:TonB-dependent receptor